MSREQDWAITGCGFSELLLAGGLDGTGFAGGHGVTPDPFNI